jgi:hypothetical protein
MNSSANQISPVSRRREVLAGGFVFPDRQVLSGRLGKSRPGPAASGANMPSTAAFAQGGKLGIRRRRQAGGFAISPIAYRE